MSRKCFFQQRFKLDLTLDEIETLLLGKKILDNDDETLSTFFMTQK